MSAPRLWAGDEENLGKSGMEVVELRLVPMPEATLGRVGVKVVFHTCKRNSKLRNVLASESRKVGPGTRHVLEQTLPKVVVRASNAPRGQLAVFRGPDRIDAG